MIAKTTLEDFAEARQIKVKLLNQNNPDSFSKSSSASVTSIEGYNHDGALVVECAGFME
jgi:hypothetical protein